MRKHHQSNLAKFIAIALAVLTALPLACRAQDAAPESMHFQLDVSINGQPTGMIGDFVDLGGGHFAATARELNELGIKTPEGARGDDLVALDSIADLGYIYDEPHQAMALVTVDGNRITKSYNARGEREELKTRSSDYGAVLNYDVYAAHGGNGSISSFGASGFSGINTSLDARLIAPVGVLNQTAIVGMTLNDQTDFLRLNTTYTFSDDENLVTWRGGDFVTGGLGWSRPVRLGGVQVQRSFSMRPDLVTTPLPAVSGSAAVPSTVDVFVNGVKSYSQQVGAGPYQIDNVPSISGAGVAQVVTTDASGKESIQTLSFYTSPHLLRPGLYDFSAETGVLRQSFGVDSYGYDDSVVGSATLRTGISDWLTAETHGEAGGGLVNAGAGIVARVDDVGIVSVAASGSSSSRGTGFQLYGALETKLGPLSVNMRTQHVFRDYDDLATLTARADTARFGDSTLFIPGSIHNILSFAPPRGIDALTLSMPIAFDKSSISTTLLRYQPEIGATTNIVTATYSRPLVYDANMFATGYTDISDTASAGFFVGVNVPLGNNVSTNTGLSGRRNQLSASADVSKPVSQETGSWGWRVHDNESDNGLRTAAVGHRMAAARVEATVLQDRNGVRETAEVEGAVALLGGSVYATNRIDDSFAVVDAHAPGVKVQRENTFVGETDDDGKILIPSLNAYQKNKISIDPMGLPLNAEIASTVDYVTPGYRSGVYVDFNVKQATPSALVVLHDTKGAVLPAGSEGRLEGSDEPFIVGYDGQAFIKNLSAVNTVYVGAGGHECRAQFSFAPTGEAQQAIGPEICQ